MEETEIVRTTIGELIAALTEEALRVVRDEEEAYRVVAFSLAHLLQESAAASRGRQSWH